MSDPADVVAQLLSPQQAVTLQALGQRVWESAARALQAIQGAPPALTLGEARLVMPDEIAGELSEPHLAVPIELTTDNDQSVTAYLVLPTASAAAYLQTEADNPEDQEQQTLVVAATILGQVVQALNHEVLAHSTNGLIVSFDDITANTMGATLAALDDACLFLTATIATSRAVPVTLVFPGTFLDILAGSMASAVAKGAQIDTPLITQEDLEAAELLDVELNRIEETPAPPPPPSATRPAASAPAPPPKEQPPVAAQRARFTPLPDPSPRDYTAGIELLAGLEMNVTVELGRTRLTVAEVLSLGPGSVVELDRIAGEPVDILVNDRLVARGEVVVVDENFGVRVVEVVRRGHEVEEPETVA